MDWPRGAAAPQEVMELKARIQSWRRLRRGREHMPKEFWTQALDLAETFGACRVARAVGLDYKGMRRKIALVGRRSKPAPQRFLEVPAQMVIPAKGELSGPVEPAAQPRTTVEVTAADGAQLRLQVPAATASELADLVSAFLGRRR